MIFDPRGHDARVAGVALRLASGHDVRLFISFCVKVSDESALRQVWQCKGAGGIKLCLLCKNVVQSKEPKETNKQPLQPLLNFDTTSLLVSHTESDYAKFALHTKESITEVLLTLQRLKGTVSNDIFEAEETAHGWNDPTHSVLMDPDLRDMLDPSEQTCFDWAHCFCVHGIFNVTFGCMMIALKPLGITYVTLHDWVLMWNWPARVGVRASGIADVFGLKRGKSSWKAKVLNASISEALSLYPVVANFVATAVAPTGRAPEVCTAYMSVCHVLDMLVVSARKGVVAASDLHNALKTFMDNFKAAFGDIAITPKFHLALHLPLFLRKFGFLPVCTTHERKHRVVKEFLKDLKNSIGFDHTIIREATCHHLEYLKTPNRFGLEVGLEEPIRTCKGNLQKYLLSAEFGADPAMPMLTSICARHAAYGRCSRGDVVALDTDEGLVVGRLQSLVSIDNISVAIVQRFKLDRHVGLDFGHWIVTDTALVYELEGIIETLLWTVSDGHVTVLYPYSMRVGILRRCSDAHA